MEKVFALPNGEELVASVLGPGEGRGTGAAQQETYSFLTRPFDPWMVPAEGGFLAEFLAGTHDPSLADTMLVGRIDGTVVGTAWHGTSRTCRRWAAMGSCSPNPSSAARASRSG